MAIRSPTTTYVESTQSRCRRSLHIVRYDPKIAIAWFVEDVSPAARTAARMSVIDVDDRHCDLCSSGRLSLCRIEGKVKVGTLHPGDFCVPSANAAVLNLIVAGMEV